MKIYLCSHLVTLRWKARETVANLEQISRQVATVNSEQAVPVGTPLTICAGNFQMRGTVQRCETDLAGYFVDVALDWEWTVEEFAPEHFFDPSGMAGE